MPHHYKEERRARSPKRSVSKASQLHLAVTTTIFHADYHVDPNTKLANIIPSLQLQPSTIHIANASPFVEANANATLSTPLPLPPKLEPGQIPERASDAPSSSMVNIINAISGGSNDPVHEMKRQHKEYFRTVSHMSKGKHF